MATELSHSSGRLRYVLPVLRIKPGDANLLIQIQGVPRRVLKVILSLESGKKAQEQRPMQEKSRSVQASASATSASQNAVPRTEESHSSTLATALSIIAEESGLAVADLAGGTNFADVGIDSLLGLTISARFREQLDVDLDFNALFYEHPTVRDLKAFLAGFGADAGATSSSGSTDAGLDTPPTGYTTGITTPDTHDHYSAPEVDFRRALQIVSEESGLEPKDLNDNTNFADCGVDSLLSLVIVSRFQDEFGLDVRHESLFLDCPTVGDLKQLLLRELSATSSVQPVAHSQPVSMLVPET